MQAVRQLKKWSLITHISLFFIFALLLFFNVFETLDFRAQDMLYQKEGRADAEIVLLAIDDESLEMLGRWPWPRDYHAQLLATLAEGEPAVIGFDVIFSEPSFDPDDDAALVAQAESLGDSLIFPAYGTFAPTASKGRLEALSVTRPFVALDEFGQLGHINTLMDNDGLVRRTILTIQSTDSGRGDAAAGGQIGDKIIYPSFAWKVYEKYVGDLALSMEEIPLDSWERAFIRYTGRPGDFEAIPAWMVVTGQISPEYFRDKIVLIGPTAIGLADDYYFTPMAPQVPMYGVEIHANIVQMLIEGRFWKEISLTGQLFFLLLMGLAGFGIFKRLKPGPGLLALTGLIIFLLFGARAAAGNLNPGLIFSFIYPAGFVGTQYMAILGQKFIEEQLEKKRVTDVFGKYVAPQIVEKILDEGEEGLHLGGIRRDITVLFVDIRGFTPLSEAAQPEEVVSILNDYLTLCAKAIFEYGGTLDKYIGDAAMALYNAPLDLDNHQLRAVQTAWAMHEGAQPLQEQLEQRFGKVVRFGVGIHTGPAIVGNVGASFRMDYTAIGDTVNTAARIESNSKPGQILISQAVYDYVKDHVEVTDIGPLQMKGKAQGVQVYQVDKLI